MRRHWSQRMLALFGAIWFILMGIEPATFGACPMLQSAGPATSLVGHAMPMRMDGAAAQHESHDGQNSGTPTQHEHQCTCPGSCCGPTVVPAISLQSTMAIVATVTTAQPSAEHRHRANWTDVVLPFATAPPNSLLA
jgi:hypothetical protein